MRYDLVIRNLDPELMKAFRHWCEDNGIPIVGRKSLIGPTVCEIIKQHITKDREDTKTRLGTLKDILDRNVIPKKAYYAPQKYIEAIVAQTMIISSPNLIRNYAALCGYEYDRRRRMYKVPDRATPASQSSFNDRPELEPEAEVILKITTDHAEKVRQERADSVRSTSSNQEDRPGSSPGPRTTYKGNVPSRCPGCRKTIENDQLKTIYKGNTWHDTCATANENIIVAMERDRYPRPKLPKDAKPGDIHKVHEDGTLGKLPPGEPGKTLTTAGCKRGKPRAANHPMPSCPVCNLPVHTRQSSVEEKGKTYHEECYEDRARTVKA